MLVCGDYGALCPRGEPFERRAALRHQPAEQALQGRAAGGDEPLLRRLLGDAHRVADLGPGRSRLARLVDEVADQVAGDVAEVLGKLNGGGHVLERPAALAVDVADEV